MNNTSLTTLRNLLILTLFLLVGMAVAFYLRPQPFEQRIALGEQLGGDFTLQGLNGPVSLADFRGKVVVMYIGYASCPDVCPTSLGILSTAMMKLNEAEQAQIQPLFISVDPQRDTPERLDEYARYFHPRMLGISGSRQQIDQVVKQYGSYYRIVQLEDSALDYAVDHTSRLYLIDRQGKLSSTLTHNSYPDELAQALRQLL
ncbi:SCO family protein [Marinobacterium arenosum]|uniref:SCO family protein n=1 Tax=Marinobacterium arenosum TaxID=2862496 RepID=UPI001C93FC23|nr:SCO family protein [Marinobacterium arenosum]MBY4677677.1 SCO family protein [Marinobacterium arenosum]